MKNQSCFGTLDEWKTALMLLPDEAFFELMRSVFGNIKTPFSKQRLTGDLFTLLSRADVRDTIAAYIDEKDRKVIAAVALLNSPVPRDLESFFHAEFSYGELYALLGNLEERLVLYRFGDGGARRLALNPALESILRPIAASDGELFPSLPLDEKNKDENGRALSGSFAADPRGMAALFSFFETGGNFFKAEGGIRKKNLDEGKRFFPGLDLELAAAVLVKLGLFNRGEETLVPDRRRVRDFSLLSPREREEYWAAARYLHLYENGREKFGFSGLKEKAALIHRFRDILDVSARYPKITLRRRLILLARENSEKETWGGRLFGGAPELQIDPFIETLEQCGLLKREGAFWRNTKNETKARADKKNGNAVIAMDSAFSFVLYPEIDFADALELVSFCSLKADGGFELARAACIRGFDRGKNSAALVGLLTRLSGGRIDGNLEWTLKDWESQYASVSLYQGQILVLAEDRRYLAEAQPLASMIEKTLAAGVYLLASGDRRQIAAALRKAGVDIFSQAGAGFQAEEKKSGNEKFLPASFPPLAPQAPLAKKSAPSPRFAEAEKTAGKNAAAETRGLSSAKKRGVDNNRANPSALKKRFADHLEKMKLPETERKELASRIERRLVFTEAQLEDASLKYEKLEARGLDYAGKTVLARQAVAAGSVLEISWPEPGGMIKTAAGVPDALEKQEGENYIVLRLSESKEGELRLPLAKISRLRLIKQSIFED